MAQDTEKNENPEALYHYTNEERQKAILESKKLKPSLKKQNSKDTIYGEGQYFTDIKENTKTNSQISRALVGLPYRGDRFTHYIQIDVKGLDVQKCREHVYLNKNKEDLDLSGLIISSGENTK